MARPGITQQEVYSAAAQLMAQGLPPTIEQVRQILQTGSNSTIANHLREWRKEQDQGQMLAIEADLPQEAVSLLKGLWERLKDLSEKKCSAIESAYQQEAMDLRHELEKYRSNNQRWQQLFNQWQQEKEALLAEKAELAQDLSMQEQENGRLKLAQEVQAKELAEKNERIDELHRLHHQVQANLEHYRETAREQRLLDREHYEQKLREMDGSVQKLEAVFQEARAERVFFERKSEAAFAENETLKVQTAKLESQAALLQARLEDAADSLTRVTQEARHYKEEQQGLLKNQEGFTEAMSEFKMRIAVLSQENEGLKFELSALTEQNKVFAQEKWELLQEKSQLSGQLKQLQAMSA